MVSFLRYERADVKGTPNPLLAPGAPNSGGATSHIDLCISGASGTDEIEGYTSNPVISGAVTCTGPNATGADPFSRLTRIAMAN